MPFAESNTVPAEKAYCVTLLSLSHVTVAVLFSYVARNCSGWSFQVHVPGSAVAVAVGDGMVNSFAGRSSTVELLFATEAVKLDVV